jgi:aminodeoxyfutalosine synthase
MLKARLRPFERKILEKAERGERITDEEALELYRSNHLAFLSLAASIVRERFHGKETYFNRNFHIEPTNICIYDCAFCAFARRPGEEGAWELTLDEIERIAEQYKDTGVTEVHIVGGVHPKRDVHYYGEMIQRIKRILPGIHVKAFTAVELKVMFARSRMSIEEGLKTLREYGLDSLPGGGAEIFHPDVREHICDKKASTENWLTIHETAHRLGIPSNCTMLYGHIEKYAHRVHHMRLLRELQDRTHGFNTFIPLKFRRENNRLGDLKEVSLIEDLKNYAVARLYLDNIPHLKAYWPMIGRETAQLSLAYGVDDLDGTINDTTKIYSMAGAEEKNPAMSSEELIYLIQSAGYIPVERDSLYHKIKVYSSEDGVPQL